MKNYAKIDHTNRTIIMDRTFAKNAEIVGSPEYNQLQACRKDYPTYTVVQRHIKRNPAKECYRGLTYEYMEDYIMTHGPNETRLANYKEFNEMRLISECHGKAFRYPVIKNWFMEKYPEIANYGLIEVEVNHDIPAEDDTAINAA